MVQDTTTDFASAESTFKDALSTLTGALEDAANATQALQELTPTLASVSRLIADLEERMERAREVLGQSAPASVENTDPAAIPPVTRGEQPVTPTLVFSATDDSPAEDAPAPEPERSSPCYILDVKSTSGPLDLKAVDSSVNSNADVVDVALLDYDGRRATLKIWFDGGVNLLDARAALRENLQRHLGGQPADVTLEPAEESAA